MLQLTHQKVQFVKFQQTIRCLFHSHGLHSRQTTKNVNLFNVQQNLYIFITYLNIVSSLGFIITLNKKRRRKKLMQIYETKYTKKTNNHQQSQHTARARAREDFCAFTNVLQKNNTKYIFFSQLNVEASHQLNFVFRFDQNDYLVRSSNLDSF